MQLEDLTRVQKYKKLGFPIAMLPVHIILSIISKIIIDNSSDTFHIQA